jgi:hypothetical protein
VAGISQAQASEPNAQARKMPLSAEAKGALGKLLEGNRRFVAGKPLNQHTSLE